MLGSPPYGELLKSRWHACI